LKRIKTFIDMENMTLSQLDLNIEDINLSEINGGSETIPSGSGIDGRTGHTVHEFCICYDDGRFELAYTA